MPSKYVFNNGQNALLKAGVGLCCLLFSLLVSAETIKVGLEPMPPLIIDKTKGHTVSILRAIENISDLRFEIIIMPYNRAKSELKLGHIDLIAHTPYQLEEPEFYAYAVELDFNIPVKTDLYVMAESKLADLSKLKIGVPRGNEKLASDITGIAVKNFYSGEIESLLRMLAVGRIDAYWFERSSTMQTIKKLNIRQVYYQEDKKAVPAGMAIRKTKSSMDLKLKLDKLILQVRPELILKGYYDAYANLPKKGVVNP